MSRSFLVIPLDIIEDQNLSASEKILLSDLLNSIDYFERIGKDYSPSLNLLSKRVGMAYDYVDHILHSLDEKKYIKLNIDESGFRTITK